MAEYESINDLIDANGAQHAASLMLGTASAQPPLYEKNVRPNVDLVAGGGELQRIFNYFGSNVKESLADAIRREILRLDRTYDLVLIDSPPIDLTALDAILRVAGR